jgi:hypothetical protein
VHLLRFHRRCQSRPQRAPSCAVWFSSESTHLPTHSQPDRSVESPLYLLHRLVHQTSLYHILCQAVPMSAHGCTIFMGDHSTNRSLDLGMMTNHRLSESTGQSPKLSESTKHSSKNHHPKSLFSTLIGNQGTSIPGDNMDKNKVLVCYPNPD